MKNLIYAITGIGVLAYMLATANIADAQWRTDLSDNVKIAQVTSSTWSLIVTCERFTNHKTVQVHVPKWMDIQTDNVGEGFVGFSWNGSDHNFDLPIGRIRTSSQIQSIIVSKADQPLSASVPGLINKLKRYGTVKVLVTDENLQQYTRTFTLRGSSNAIDRVQRACR